MVEHYNKLVKLAVRAFYDDWTSKGDNQPKTGKSDNKGIAVVVLDALTRRQWVREEDLAKDLKLHTKQLRRTLRFFEEEKFITRYHRKETVKGAKMYSAAVAATIDGSLAPKEGEEKVKLNTHSYCCLDYAQIYDVVRYRLHRVKKKLKDQLENKNTVQEYLCPNCGKRYNALDALRLISFEDEDFHCENCNGTLEIESHKLAAQEGGDDEMSKKDHRENLKSKLQKMEEQLKPLMDQLSRVKDLPVPEFGSLEAWEARARASGLAANGDSSMGDSKIPHGLGYGGTPMPYSGDTKVVVDFNGAEGRGEDIKSVTESTSLKVLPPWMIKQGMSLTKEQRGEVKQEMKMDGASTSTTAQYSDDKKSAVEQDEKKSLQDEYIKAYYAALLKKQQEMEEAAKAQEQSSNTSAFEDPFSGPSQRQVGMKAKREEDDDTEWEEASIPDFKGNTNENYKVNDLNVEAEAAPDDEGEEDDVDWEEG